jgi:hypothetical protein
MDDLHGTLLWREGIERHLASTFHEAFLIAVAARPSLILVEYALPQAMRLVTDLRQEHPTRGLSIAVMMGSDVGLSEVDLLESGANAVLRLPVAPGWDERLGRLMNVAGRRDARLPLRAEFVAEFGGSVQRVEATTVNISVTGLLMECPALLSLGTDLDLCLRLPGSDVVGCGRIVRRDSSGRYGVEFYALEADGAARVASLVTGGASRSAERHRG